MSDLIRRQDVIDAALTFLVEYCGAAFDEDMQKMLCERLDALPSAEPERKKGKWENASINTYELSYGTTAYEPVYRCSACGGVTESYLRLDEPIIPEDADFPNFCPHCGADTREKYEDIPMEYFENGGI